LKLAACDQLVCFFRFNDRSMLSALATPAVRSARAVEALA
jgi:hypothetical protein